MRLEDFATAEGPLNLTAAAQMAALCCMVYEGERDEIQQFVKPEGRLAYFTASEGTWVPSFAVIDAGDKRWFVISEGTISFTQALAQGSPLNALSPVLPEPLVINSCYGLFYNQVYRQLYDRVKDIIPFSDPELRLFLSGHSMGGAVAQVAAFEFARNVDPTRVQLLTLGQPKGAGDNSGWGYPEPEVYFRIASLLDPVKEYPEYFIQWFVNWATLRVFSGLFPQGWRHYGSLVTLSANGVNGYTGLPTYPLAQGMGIGPEGEHGLSNYLARILLKAQVDFG